MAYKLKQIHLADNLDLLKSYHNSGQVKFIDLIYIDPPFNSKRNYNMVFKTDTDTTENAFSDIWSNVSYLDELEEVARINPNLFSFLKMLEGTGLPKSYISYLTAMSIRVWYMRELMKETASFYYHCDPTMSHYIKVMLDYIFGRENFRNEIVWSYQRWTGKTSAFQRTHDCVLFYSKNNENTYNEQTEPYSEKSKHTGKRFSTKIDGKLQQEYIDTTREKAMRDVWDISILNSQASERLGYPTQKPEALLERIIKASTNEGDIVADFYMGGATTLAVAERLGREYLGCDINYRAIQIGKERLEKLGLTIKKDFFIFGIPRSSKELRRMVDENIMGEEKNSRFALEDVIVKYYMKGVIGNASKIGDSSIDGVFNFKYKDKNYKGLVQVTSGSNKNHLKAFCSEIGKGTGSIGIYVTFADNITDGFIKEVKGYGKFEGVDKIQLLTIEDLVDKGNMFTLPDGSMLA